MSDTTHESLLDDVFYDVFYALYILHLVPQNKPQFKDKEKFSIL